MNLVKIAHLLWTQHLKPGMTVIDATAGNGYDTLFLAKQVLSDSNGHVHAFDIQKEAIESTAALLKKNLPPFQLDHLTLHHASHEFFPIGLKNIDLIAYNLGYRPAGNKKITTIAPITIKSCQSALDILAPHGLLSIMIYPGHPQGSLEKESLYNWLNSLSSKKLYISIHTPFNRPNAPILLIISKLDNHK